MTGTTEGDGQSRANAFRFNLTGLMLYSASLVAIAGAVGGTLAARRGDAASAETRPAARPDHPDAALTDIPDEDAQTSGYHVRTGPWGELLVRNIKLERPGELVAVDTASTPPETWTFRGATPAGVRELLVANGLTAEEAGRALAAEHVRQDGADTVVVPGDDLILSLAPDTRQRLLTGLRGRGVSLMIDFPYTFQGEAIDLVYADKRLDPADVQVLRKLAYRCGDATQLADYATLMRAIPTAQRRIAMSKTLSRQPAVLARICVRPDTDIDKVAGYWGHMDNVHFNDVRPLLESLREQPHGGTVSLVHVLPPFARDRLYTYPIRKPGDPGMDCHWTTFNFSSLQPDNRFDDPGYTTQFLADNYYAIGAPAVYGDLVVLVDAKPLIQHSAVFLADDLVFTKYGLNERQPWMIVHIADMLARYPGMKPVYFRRRAS